MWRHIAQSVVGRNHSGDGASCQDTCVVRVLGEGDAPVLVACVADGAGSSTQGAVGAQLACDTVMLAAVAHFDEHRRLDNLDSAAVEHWLDAARDALSQRAAERDHALRDYATTLCVAITSAERSVFVQIGDGVIVARRHGPLGVVFWPQSGEYANTTTFLTSAEYRDVVQIAVFDHGFTDVAILTDGLSRLALRFDSLTAHPPFFQPLFHALRAAADVDVLSEELRQFLSSDQVQSKTDDDKTLVLASQVSDDDGHAH